MKEASQSAQYDIFWKQRGERTGDRCGYEPNMRKWMAKELQTFPREESLLEVGCGDCQFTCELKAFSNRVVALDISDLQIKKNQEKYPDIEFHVQDLIEPLRFRDGEIGAIWCSEVIEHLAQPMFAVREMHRVLKSGGRLLLTVPYHGLLKNVLIALFKWDQHFDPEYPHLQYFTKQTLSKPATKAGFHAVNVSSCGMGKPFRDLIIPTNLLLSAVK